MSLKDIFLGPLFFVIVWLIANALKNRLAKTELEKKIYTRALLIKLLGVTFFALIYQFYYGGGDSMGFYAWAEKFPLFLFDEPVAALKFLFTQSEEAFYQFKFGYYDNSYGYILKYGSRETTLIKMTAILNLLAFHSYLSTAYLFALISFLGNWSLYRVFIHYFPTIKKELAWATLYIPSVAFWGTSILKDTLTFAAIGFLVYAVWKVFLQKENLLRNIFLMLLSIYIIMLLKAYIFLAFLPAGVIWVFNEKKAQIKSKALQFILTPFFIVLIAGTLGGLLAVVGDSAGRFSIDNLEKTTKDFQSWHTVASDGGSGYTLKNTSFTPMGLLFAIPESINVTYFRPYLWEGSSIVVLFGALESLAIFLFFLYVFFVKGKVFLFFHAIFSKPIIQMCLIYALFFGFVVGYTSFNFGALARYKIPSMPFFVAMLFMIAHQIDVLLGKKR